MFIPYFQQCRFALSHLQAFSKTNTEEFVIHKHMHFLLKLSSPSFPKGFPFNGVLSKKDFEKPQGLASKQMLNTLSIGRAERVEKRRMLTGQWVGSTGQQNKAASAGQMHRRKDSRKHRCVITDGSRLLFFWLCLL